MRELENAKGNEHKDAIASAAILDACPKSAFRLSQFEDLSMRSGRLDPRDRTLAMLPPDEIKVLWSTVCPPDRIDDLRADMAAIDRDAFTYDVCGWQDFGVAYRSEMNGEVALGVTWAYYPLLRKYKVPHHLARPLVRALIFSYVPDDPE